jgi:Family of unknown function (DUF5937)
MVESADQTARTLRNPYSEGAMFTSSIPLHRQENRHSPFTQQIARPLSRSRANASVFQTHVNIRLQAEDLASVRFAVSPLGECIAAFRAWMDPHSPALFLPWKTQLSDKLAELDWGVLADFALLRRGSIPDFLCPPPLTPMPALDEELEILRGTPEDLFRAEVRIAYGGRIPTYLSRAMLEPQECLNRLADLIEKFWEKAIAPHWASLRARLEGEMLYRARTLAVGGIAELFAGLHKDVTLQDDCLTVRTLSHWDGGKRNPGLLLMPSIFAWPDVCLTVRLPWRTAIRYPSRGIADLWEHTSSSCAKGLQLLVGCSCAKVISNFQVPRTTMEMSAAIGLSPAATSEQITKLRAVGILERTRIGRRVFYSLNQRGMALLTSINA